MTNERNIEGGSAVPVYIVPDNELKENNGYRIVEGGLSVPVYVTNYLTPTPPVEPLPPPPPVSN